MENLIFLIGISFVFYLLFVKNGKFQTRRFATSVTYLLVLTVITALFLGMMYYKSRYENTRTANNKFEPHNNFPSFFLKIVDQNNNGVHEALVRYSNGKNFWLGSNRASGTAYLYNGVKEFFLDGRVFDFSSFYKEGYHIDGERQLRALRGENRRGFIPKRLEQYTKDNPMIIKAWKFGEVPSFFFGQRHMKLLNNVPSYIGTLGDINRKCLSIPNPESCYNVRYTKIDKEFEGKVIFTMNRVMEEDLRHVESWNLTIEVPSGGIQQTDDLYLYAAPLQGYSQKIVLENGENAYKERRYTFYLSLDGGEKYGRMYVDFDPDRRKFGGLEVEYFVNTDCTPNLNIPIREAIRLEGGKRYSNYRFIE